VFDLARDLDWPWHFTGRVLHNDFSRRWHGDLDGLKAQIERERARYDEAAAEDYTTRVVIGGEVVDLITSVKPAADIIAETVGTALRLIRDAPTRYL
jgi:nitronate monooxygenase